jgi:hypothetical protein
LEKKNHETKSTINKPKFLKKLHWNISTIEKKSTM